MRALDRWSDFGVRYSRRIAGAVAALARDLGRLGVVWMLLSSLLAGCAARTIPTAAAEPVWCDRACQAAFERCSGSLCESERTRCRIRCDEPTEKEGTEKGLATSEAAVHEDPPVEHAIAARGGASQLIDTTKTYDRGYTVLLTYEYLQWPRESLFWSFRFGLGMSRINMWSDMGFASMELSYLPWGLLDFHVGTGRCTGGPLASFGLGVDLMAIIPLPVASEVRLGWRFPAGNTDVRLNLFGRYQATPFGSQGTFPAMSRWSTGAELGLVWGRRGKDAK